MTRQGISRIKSRTADAKIHVFSSIFVVVTKRREKSRLMKQAAMGKGIWYSSQFLAFSSVSLG